MCVEDHHTILKVSEDLNKAFGKVLTEMLDLGLNDDSKKELMIAMQELERVARYLDRKAKVVARTQP